MADFPDDIYTPRETENLPGIEYDSAQKRFLFSEDFQNLGGEINAIETFLNPITDFVGQAGKVVKVNDTEDSFEFGDGGGGGGAVDSVNGHVGVVVLDASDVGAEPAFGFTAEDVSNKDSAPSLGTSDAKYPTQKAVKTYVDSSIYYQGVALSGASFVSLFFPNNSAGDTDLYVVPSGKRLILLTAGAQNYSASTRVGQLEIKNAGSYYKFTAGLSIGANISAVWPTLGMILEYGDTLSLNLAASSANINVYFRAILCDDVSSVKSARIFALASGDNTLYTVPSGKTLFLLSFDITISTQPTAVRIFNNSGASRDYTMNFVPSGNSVGNLNKASVTSGVGNGTIGNLTGMVNLSAGDFININCSNGASYSFVWVSFIEV